MVYNSSNKRDFCFMSNNTPSVNEVSPLVELDAALAPNGQMAELKVPSVDLLPVLHIEQSQNGAYPIGHNGAVDIATPQILGEYLEDRMAGRLGERVTIGGFGGTPNTVVQKTRIAFDRWRWTGGSPEGHVTAVVAALLAVNLAVNSVGNLDDAGTALQDVGDEIARGVHNAREAVADAYDSLFGDDIVDLSGTHTIPKPPVLVSRDVEGAYNKCVDEVVPDKDVKIELSTRFPSGETTSQRIATKLWAVQIKELADQGYELGPIKVRGSSSDDWGGRDESFMNPEPENEALAKQRAESLAADMKLALKEAGVDVDVEVSYAQDQLTLKEYDELKILSKQYGYDDISSAKKIYDNPDTVDTLPDALRLAMDVTIGRERGGFVTVEGHKDGDLIRTCVPVAYGYTEYELIPQNPDVITIPPAPEEPEKPYTDPNRDYDPKLFFLPLAWPPLPKFMKQKYTKVIPGKNGFGGADINDDVFLSLYPQGIRRETDNKAELAPDAWAWSQKYQALLREGRIKGLIEHHYVDQGNNDRAFRMVFIDHEPTEIMVEKMSEILERIALLNNGRVPESLNVIAVFPRENAGAQTDPNKIGLGFDDQYGLGVLGLAMPFAGIAEMHAPKSASKADIDEVEQGIAWVLAHEVGGHFTDVYEGRKDMKLDRRSLRARIFGPRYVARNQWVDRASGIYKRFKRSNSPQWTTETTYMNLDGEPLTDVVQKEELPSPLFATGVYKNGFPTEYSETSPGELWAEAAGASLTGTELPLPRHVETNDGFAQGARIDRDLKWLFELNNSARIDNEGNVTPIQPRALEGTQTVYYKNPTDSTWLARLTRRAITTPHPGKDGLVKVSGKVRSLSNR